MITVELQEKLFNDIAQQLKRKVVAYAIGGTAMMFHGLKEATLDIDLVFSSEKDRSIFMKSAESLGYRAMDAVLVYGDRTDKPIMLKLGDVRFDLFLRKVISFEFSQKMMERAGQTHIFKESLVLKIADIHDIILMKCATDRLKDVDDARRIILDKKIDWDVLIGEAKDQVGLGRETALFELGEFLERLKFKMKLPVPEKVLDELFNLVKKQAEEKRKRARK